jgi:hypothetical protein
MTSTEKLQNHTSKCIDNAKFLQIGYRHCAVPADADDIRANMLELGGLEVLCAMMVLGETGEKVFARKKLKHYIATGKRLELRKAKSMPKQQAAPAAKCHRLSDSIPCEPGAFSSCIHCENNFDTEAQA